MNFKNENKQRIERFVDLMREDCECVGSEPNEKENEKRKSKDRTS
jgi:hypothetical protein